MWGAGQAPGKSSNWPLEAGEEVQGRGQGWQALGIGLDEQLVPCPLDPQRLAPFTLEPVTEAVLGLVIDNAVIPRLDQQQRRLDPVCLRDGGIPGLDALADPVGRHPTQLDLRMLLIELAECLVAGLAVAQAVVGKFMGDIAGLARNADQLRIH